MASGRCRSAGISTRGAIATRGVIEG